MMGGHDTALEVAFGFRGRYDVVCVVTSRPKLPLRGRGRGRERGGGGRGGERGRGRQKEAEPAIESLCQRRGP